MLDGPKATRSEAAKARTILAHGAIATREYVRQHRARVAREAGQQLLRIENEKPSRLRLVLRAIPGSVGRWVRERDEGRARKLKAIVIDHTYGLRRGADAERLRVSRAIPARTRQHIPKRYIM